MTQNRPPEPSDPRWLDDILDDLAQAPVAAPSPELMARVLADAETMLPAPGGVRPARPWWQQMVQGLGGWGAVGGLVAAAATGFAVGLGGIDPTGTDALWSLGYDTLFEETGGLDAFGWDWDEG